MNKSKMWPLGITVVLVLMIVNTIIFIFYLQDVNFDLVADDYYQEGLAYQERIDRINNSNRLSEKVQIKLKTASVLEINFPKSLNLEEIQGNIVFFRPDARELDQTFSVVLDSTGIQELEVSDFKRGNWKVKLLWNDDSKSYYDEVAIFIPSNN